MRTGYIAGMFAGSIIGAAAILIALPYIKPKYNTMVHKSKEFLDDKLDKMEL